MIALRRENLPVPSSLIILKSKKIAEELLISQDDFKASWDGLADLERRGIQQLLFHGEGAEVDRENPDLVAALDKLYAIIAKYDPKNVYNMDEIGLFFCCCLNAPSLCRLRMLAAHEGRKKLKKECHLQFVQMPQERTKSHAY